MRTAEQFLRDNQWTGVQTMYGEVESWNACLCCDRLEYQGHETDCELAAILGEPTFAEPLPRPEPPVRQGGEVGQCRPLVNELFVLDPRPSPLAACLATAKPVKRRITQGFLQHVTTNVDKSEVQSG